MLTGAISNTVVPIEHATMTRYTVRMTPSS
jgi:hypothetical protein